MSNTDNYVGQAGQGPSGGKSGGGGLEPSGDAQNKAQGGTQNNTTPNQNNQQGLADQKVRMVNSGGRQVAMHRHPGYPKGSKNGQWHPVERRHGSLGRTAQIHMEAGLGKDGYGQAGERPLGAPRPKEDPKGLMGEAGARIGEAASKVTGAMDRAAQDTAQKHPNVSRFLDMASTGAKLSGVGAKAVGRLALGSFGDVGAKGMQMMTKAMRALLSGDPMTASGRLVTQALGDISSMESTLQQSAARYGLVTDADAQTIADTVQGSMYNREARAFEQGMNAGMENISQELMNAGVTDVSQMGAAQLPVFKDALEGHIERVAQMISDGVDSNGRVLGLNDLQRLKAEMDVYGSVTDGLASRVKSAREESRVATARLTASRALEAGLRQEARRAAREQAEAGRQARMQAAEQARANGDVIPHTILTQMGYNVAVGDDGLPIQRGKLTRLENILQDQLRVLSPDGDPEEIAMVQDALNRVGEERRRQRFMDKQYASLQNQRYQSEYGELEEAEGIASPGRRSARAEEERLQPRTAHEEMFGMGGTDRDNYADVMTTMSNAKKRRAMDQLVASRIDDMENMEVEMPDGTVRVRTLEELQQDPEYQALNHYRAFSANAELVDGLMNHINRIKPDALDLIGKDQRDVAEEKAKLEQLLYANFKAHNFMPDGEGNVRALGGMPEAEQDLELIAWANNMGREYKKDIADAKKKEKAKERAAETKRKRREAEWRADLSVDTTQRKADIGVEATRQKGQSKIRTTGQVEDIKTAAENQRNIGRVKTAGKIADERIREEQERGKVRAGLTTLNTNEKIRYEREAAKEHIKRRIADLTAQRGITKEQAARLVMKEEHAQKMGEINNKTLSDEFNIRFDDLVRTNQEGLRAQKDLQELQRIAYGLEQGHQASMNDIELKHLADKYGLDLSQQASVQKLELDNLIAKLDTQMKFNDEEREKHATALADEFGLSLNQAKQLAMIDDVRLGREYLRKIAGLNAERELADHLASLGFSGVPVTSTLPVSMPVVAGGSQNVAPASTGGSGQGEAVEEQVVSGGEETVNTTENNANEIKAKPEERITVPGAGALKKEIPTNDLMIQDQINKEYYDIQNNGETTAKKKKQLVSNLVKELKSTYPDKWEQMINLAKEAAEKKSTRFEADSEDKNTNYNSISMEGLGSDEASRNKYAGISEDQRTFNKFVDVSDRKNPKLFSGGKEYYRHDGETRLKSIFEPSRDGSKPALFDGIVDAAQQEFDLGMLARAGGMPQELKNHYLNLKSISNAMNGELSAYWNFKRKRNSNLANPSDLIAIDPEYREAKEKVDALNDKINNFREKLAWKVPLLTSTDQDKNKAYAKLLEGDWANNKFNANLKKDKTVSGWYEAFNVVPDLETSADLYASKKMDSKAMNEFEMSVNSALSTFRSMQDLKGQMSPENQAEFQKRFDTLKAIKAKLDNSVADNNRRAEVAASKAREALGGMTFKDRYADELELLKNPRNDIRNGPGINSIMGFDENPKGTPEGWAELGNIRTIAENLNKNSRNQEKFKESLKDPQFRSEVEGQLASIMDFVTNRLGNNESYESLNVKGDKEIEKVIEDMFGRDEDKIASDTRKKFDYENLYSDLTNTMRKVSSLIDTHDRFEQTANQGPRKMGENVTESGIVDERPMQGSYLSNLRGSSKGFVRTLNDDLTALAGLEGLPSMNFEGEQDKYREVLSDGIDFADSLIQRMGYIDNYNALAKQYSKDSPGEVPPDHIRLLTENGGLYENVYNLRNRLKEQLQAMDQSSAEPALVEERPEPTPNQKKVTIRDIAEDLRPINGSLEGKMGKTKSERENNIQNLMQNITNIEYELDPETLANPDEEVQEASWNYIGRALKDIDKYIKLLGRNDNYEAIAQEYGDRLHEEDKEYLSDLYNNLYKLKNRMQHKLDTGDLTAEP